MRAKSLASCYNRDHRFMVHARGPGTENKKINSVEKKLLQSEQENFRLKALLKEKEEMLVASLCKGEQLHESEEKFRKLFEEHSAVMLVIDPDTANIVDANRAASSFYGWSMLCLSSSPFGWFCK